MAISFVRNSGQVATTSPLGGGAISLRVWESDAMRECAVRLRCLLLGHGPIVQRNNMLGAVTNTGWRDVCSRCGRSCR